jgi:hypothetical protein
VTTTAGATTYTEGAAAVAVDPGLTVADVDGSSLGGAVVQFTGGYVQGEDTLVFVDQNGITGVFTAATGVLTLSGTASIANYQLALRSVTFADSNGANPAQGDRTLSVVVTDVPSSGPALASTAVTKTVTVVGVDDAPTAAGPAGPFYLGTTEPFAFTGTNAVSVADVDAGTNPVQVTVAATDGTLTATAGGTAVVLGGGTTVLTVTGTVADVNTSLATLRAVAPAGPAAVTVTTTVSDLGNTGTGGPLTSAPVATTINVITPPQVQSITLANATPSTASLVRFTVTFTSPVTGVDAAAFAITANGVTATSIASVTPSSGSTSTTWTVAVASGTGTGTIRLDVVDKDAVNTNGVPLGGTGLGNGDFTAGPSYTMDRTDPTVSSFDRADASPTTAATVRFTVVFSEAVTGVDASDFVASSTGLVGSGGVTSVTGSGTTYTVTVSSGSGSGTLTLRLADDDSIKDVVGHPLAGSTGYPGPTYTIDRNSPTVTSIALADANPIGPGLARFDVTFSEPVVGVDAGDFALVTAGLDGAKVVDVSGSGTTYTVTAATGAGRGRLELDVVDNDSIADLYGNALGGVGGGNGAFTGPAYTVTPAAPGTAPRRPARVVAGSDGGGPPVVTVYDATGAVLARFLAYDPSFTGGVHVAIGDLNSDGVDDIITGPGSGGGPHVKVVDGTKLGELAPNGMIADSALLYTFQAYDESFRGGVYVAAGDINGDGRTDVVTGAGDGGGPAITIFDGKTGALMYTMMAYEDSFRGGVTVAVGDVTGDGRDDIIAGSGPGGGPAVAVFDGVTRALIGKFYAYDPNFRGGVNVAAADVDGDGIAEIITGSGLGGGAVVGVFRGAKGSQAAVFNGAGRTQGSMNGLRVAAADVTGDGRADLIVVGGPGSKPSTARVYDATGLKELGLEFAAGPDYLGGVFVGGNG